MAYTICQAAQMSGLSPHTIRFYDRQGLLPFMERGPGGVRQFSEVDMECLQIIRTLKATGMKIKEIKQYLDQCVMGDDALEKRLQFMLRHKAEVACQLEEYKHHMLVIGFKIWYYETAIKAGSEYVHDQYYADTGITPWQRYSDLIKTT